MTLSINTKNCVNAVAVSPDGKTVAVGQDSRAVTLWEVPLGNQLGSLSLVIMVGYPV
jgi:WD40 repeat protein